MIRKFRSYGTVALAATLVLFAGACSNTDDGGSVAAPPNAPSDPTQPGVVVDPTQPEDLTIAGTTLTGPLSPATILWMHNMDVGLAHNFIQQVAEEFEALHPGVVVQVQAVENDQLREIVLPDAILDDAVPDLFQSWGGGEVREWANLGVAWDLTEVLAPTINPLGSAVDNWSIDHHVYGLPYTLGPAGIWVNLNLLNQAGLVSNAVQDASGNVTSGTVDWPTTMDGLFAMWETLRDHDITPVAVGGGGGGWAAAWWWYAAATKLCSPSVLAAAGNEFDWSNSCWVEAGAELQNMINHGLLSDGWEAVPAQGSANSSAGQVALGEAAMEFMGPWNSTVMRDIINQSRGNPAGTPLPSYLAWYPLPDIVDGAGTGNIMAGGDGFSVLNPARGTQARSEAAAALLAYFMSDEVQVRFADPEVGGIPGIPVNPAAVAANDDPVITQMGQALHAAPHSVQWLDTLFGTEVGSEMNSAIVAFMGGQGAPQGIVDAINDAAGN